MSSHRHRNAVIALAIAFVVAATGAFFTTYQSIDVRQASNEGVPGTIGLARPHPPMYPVQN